MSKTPTLEAQTPSIPLGEFSHSTASPFQAESCHSDRPNHNSDSSLQMDTRPKIDSKSPPKTMPINFSKEIHQTDRQASARLAIDTKMEERIYNGAVRRGYKKVKMLVTPGSNSIQVFNVEDGDDSFINALQLIYDGSTENLEVSLVFTV